MSTPRFPPRLSLCLLLFALLGSSPAGQAQETIPSVIIEPTEATLHVGQTQSFMALVEGTVHAGYSGQFKRRTAAA